jgi:hypothetical protein
MALVATDQFGNRFSITVDSTDNDSLLVNPVSITPSTADNSISVQVSAMIASVLRLIGVLESGEPPTSDENNDSFAALNQMIDAWNADGLSIYTTRSDDYTLIAGQQSYTLGNGGDFNSNRPARINSMSAILLDNPTNPIEVPMVSYTIDEWQNKIPVKQVMSTFPQVYYDTGDFPLRTINFWPIPSTSANNVRIYSWQALGLPVALNSYMAFPPGYAEAFRYNLAIRLAPEFSAPVAPFVQTNAVESLARLKTMNAPLLNLMSDLLPTEGGYNYRADMFNIGY